MKLEKQIEAMALIDGFTEISMRSDKLPLPLRGIDYICGIKFDEIITPLPNYTTNNEIDRMVRGLGEKLIESYILQFTYLLDPKADLDWHEIMPSLLQATPAQKVEAFLKAHGEWK